MTTVNKGPQELPPFTPMSPTSTTKPIDAADTSAREDQPATSHPDSIGSVALLGLGLLLESADWVTRQAYPSQPDNTTATTGVEAPPSTSARRSAFIGLVVEARVQARERRDAVRLARRDILRRLSKAASPVSHFLPVEVALAATEILVDFGQRTAERSIERLARQGRVEEERARALAQRAILGWINEALTYATSNPEVRELVTQQGGELATSALDELRTRSESVDTWLAQITQRVIKRSGQAKAPPPTDAAIATKSPSHDSGV